MENDKSKLKSLIFYLPFLLVAILFVILFGIVNRSSENPASPMRYGVAVFVPVMIASVGYRSKSLDFSGLLAALVVGFLLTISSYCFSTSLIVFFLTGSSATKFRGDQKRLLEEDFKEGGQRTWIQVVCNGGVAAQLGLLYAIDIGSKEIPVNFISNYNASLLSMAILGALACCLGDTLASELGTVMWCGEPRLITNMQKVKKGTNGGVSIAGLFASGLGGLILGVTYYLTLLLSINHRLLYKSPAQWPIVLQGMICGFIGSLVDSFLGATVQFSGYDEEQRLMVEHPGTSVKHISGRNWLDNHSVNLASGFITAMLSPILAYYIWPVFN